MPTFAPCPSVTAAPAWSSRLSVAWMVALSSASISASSGMGITLSRAAEASDRMPSIVDLCVCVGGGKGVVAVR